MKRTNDNKWNEWFAGFMDGDGSILVYKNHVSIEATTGIEDEGILIEIKKKFGGSIKPRSNARALRWRSRSKVVVLKIIETLNGFLYNLIRIEQLKKACIFYNIAFIQKNTYTSIKDMKTTAYLSGLFDADGSISINSYTVNKNLTNIDGLYGKVQRLIYSKGHNQCIIKCTNKDKRNIEILMQLGYGKLYYEKNKENQTKWHWIVQKNEIYEFLNDLKTNPLKGKKKKNRLHLLPEYIRLKTIKAHLVEENSILFKEWKNFCYKWYNLIEP
jgi:hypothetical protein